MPKPTKARRPRARNAMGWWVFLAFASAVVALIWWQTSKVKAGPGKTITSSPAANPPSSSTASNAFSFEKFNGWLTNQADAEELMGTGGRLLEEGRVGLSILCFRRTLELKPEDEEACFNLGVAFSRIGQFAEAEQAYRRALTNFNEYAEARNNLGNLLTRQKRYAEATEEFNIVLQHAPDNAAAHNNLGRVLAEQGNTLAALQQFTEAARLDTNYVDARFNAGALHLTMGRTNEAVASFRETLRLRPDFQPALNALAKMQKTP